MPFARIATVAAVAVLLTLAGCDHPPAPARTPAPPPPAAEQQEAVTAVPSEPATGSPRPAPASPSPKRPVGVDAGSGDTGLDRFVAAVQRKLPDVALDRRDEEVEDLGERACDALGHGRGAASAAGEISAQGVPSADARTLVGLARDTLCRS